MRSVIFALAGYALMAPALRAQMSMDHMIMPPRRAGGAPIMVTINPESRVLAMVAGPLPAAAPCAAGIAAPIEIVNQGFVTAPLEARLAGQRPPDAMLALDRTPLTGVREERRLLRIKLATPGQTDLTIVFGTRNEIPDSGGHDTIHFIAECR
jgi:hypothetical protein